MVFLFDIPGFVSFLRDREMPGFEDLFDASEADIAAVPPPELPAELAAIICSLCEVKVPTFFFTHTIVKYYISMY